MKKRQPPQDLVLSDAEVREVIERAVRAEPRGGITVTELRQIAAELDIDPHALERALDQVVGMPIAGKPIRSWLKRQLTKLGRLADAFLPQSGRLAGCIMFGAIAGWLHAFLNTYSINPHYPIAAAMVGLTFANLLSRRLDRKLGRYILEIIAMWIAYGAGWSITYGGVTDNLVAWVVLWTSNATLLGYILMRDASGTDTLGPGAVAQPESVAQTQSDDDATRVNRVRMLFWPALVRPAREAGI